jgi:hypothetical protein
MTYSTLTDDGSYRAQQEHEEAKLAYILDLIDRVRSRTSTEDDAEFLTRELTPYTTQPRK